jgi:CRISPR/Cas system CSM-associated protein Csm3 (group 7 of RAMP superfamily)
MTTEKIRSRNVIERVYVAGALVLDTPAHFGNGDADAITDIPLLRDSLDGRQPLLSGASIAGALRNYLHEVERGYGAPDGQRGDSLAEALFGHLVGYESTVESRLMIDDALGVSPTGHEVEIRDGVSIEADKRTAEEGKKYDIELLSAGTTFPLRFELWLTDKDSDALLDGLVTALRGLEEGQIGLGARKRRGYGQCHVEGWHTWRYRMEEPAGVLGWLTHSFESSPAHAEGLPKATTLTHRGERFILDATFRLQGPLLIRADSGSPNAADMVHLRSWRDGGERPILSGTSVAGALRARAARIARTLKGDRSAETLIDGMFGQRIKRATDEPSGSRVLVRETVVENGVADRVQSRVKLDRFTGGAFPQALFSQQPLFGKEAAPTEARLYLELRKAPPSMQPQSDAEQKSKAERELEAVRQFQAEIGLLLLVLKDLWTEDLPLGGESGAGRGRLRGQSATLTLGDRVWKLTANGRGVQVDAVNGSTADLEEIYLRAFKEYPFEDKR